MAHRPTLEEQRAIRKDKAGRLLETLKTLRTQWEELKGADQELSFSVNDKLRQLDRDIELAKSDEQGKRREIDEWQAKVQRNRDELNKKKAQFRALQNRWVCMIIILQKVWRFHLKSGPSRGRGVGAAKVYCTGVTDIICSFLFEDFPDKW